MPLKLSLITPSLNQAAFVKKSLESVESQTVPPWEHIIFDARSSDGTLEILSGYAEKNAYATLHIGRDRNQTHAINMGFSESSGDVLGWLNTDDFYASSGALERILLEFENNPDVDFVYGNGRFVDVNGKVLRDAFINSDATALPQLLATSVGILQPATFFRRRAFEQVGKLNERLNFCMDYEYWIRLTKSGAKFRYLNDLICDATLHTDSKTMGQRVRSLRETVEMVQKEYGFAPVEWLERLADAELFGSDGIIRHTAPSQALEERTERLFMQYNGSPEAKARIEEIGDRLEGKRTAKLLKGIQNDCNTYFVTAFDSSFFESGLTLLAHLERFAERPYRVIVFDLGLTPAEISVLESISEVDVLSLPRDDSRYFDGYFSGQTYGFKSYAAWRIGGFAAPDTNVVWIDAGIAPIRSMQNIWAVIEDCGAFFVDHDDKSAWPFFNANFTSPACIDTIKASNDELIAPHIRAGLFGFRTGSRFHDIVNEAFMYSLSPAALAGEKHPLRTSSEASVEAEQIRAKALRDPGFRNSISRDTLQNAFGYFGHRHDQSILSILVARHGAPVQSARKFVVADDYSSSVSKQNWQKSSQSGRIPRTGEIAPYYLESDAICMQHRGTYTNSTFLDPSVNLRVAALLEEIEHTESPPARERLTLCTHENNVAEDPISLYTPDTPGCISRQNTPKEGTESLTSYGEIFERELQTIPRNPNRKVETPPSISIVTPNFNSADFIERTLTSVIEQDYPNLEYVVVDGASTDGSQEIINRYAENISRFVSEPDHGHSDALNKGFALTSGDIMGWINSDDILLPGSLAAIGEVFAKYPEVEWITGQPTVIEEDGTWKLHNLRKWSRVRFLNGNYRWVQQESTFWRRSLWDRAGGGLSRDIELAVDFELWVRFFRHAELYTYQLPLGAFRYRDGQRSKAFRERYEAEALSIIHQEAATLDSNYKKIFQAMFPDSIRPLEYLEVGARERELSVCDPPVISVADVSKRKEVAFDPARVPAKRHDSLEHLLRCDDLKRFRGLHSGKRCFIVGNGPSLNKMDLNKLDGEYVFACNSFFLMFDKIKWRPTFYTCVDSRVLPDRAKEIDAMLAANPFMTAFFPNEIVEHSGEARRYPTRTILPPDKGRYYFRERPNSLINPPYSSFSKDINDHVVQPYTVAITMLQIAAYMGFSEIYLIGCDTSYVVPADTVKEGVKANGEVGLALTSTADNDPNHFDPRYFGAGRKWHDPQPEMMIEHHKHAKVACDELGIKVFNATVGGNLEVYARKDFNSLFPPHPQSSKSPEPLDARQRGAEIDETGVVAHMLAARQGPNHVMLDVGAHFGTSAQYFHTLGWTIHCFEPDPKNREKLVAKFGQAKNVTIDPRAVSDRAATGVPLFSSKESTGISGLSAFHKTHEESARVDVTTVADIIRDRGISHVDFLKIDVEGFDFGVLKGVPWDRLKPDVVECEFEDAKTVPLGHTWKDIADFLCGHGYHVYVSEWHPIIRYGIPHDWRRVYKYPGPPIDASAWGNFLAFREDPGLPAIKAAFDALIRYRPVVTAPPQPDKTLSSPVGAIGAKSAKNLKDSAGGAANLNPATAGIPVAARQTNNDDRVNMLKKTPPNALEATPPARMWYAEPAERLRQASPQLFTLLQFARRSFVHVISRPHLLVVLLAVLAGASWVSLDAQFAANRGWLLAGGGFALVTLGLIYIAAKAQAHAATLHVRAANLERELFALKDTAARTQQLVTLNSHSRADAISARIAQLQSELALARAANAKLTSDFSKLMGELNKLSASATAAQTLKADVEKLAGATAALPQLRGEVTNLSAALPQLQAEVTNLSAAVQAIPQSLEPKIQESKDAAQKLTSELAVRIADLAKQVEAGKTTDASLQTSIQDIQASMKALQDQRAGIETAVANASAKVQSAEDRLATTEKWSRFDNAAWFQHFNRKLSRQHVETLDKEWRKRLSIPMQPATLGYMANRACEIERQLEGRLATSIEDILLRALVARAVKGKSVDVLEIGTLFGTGAAIMFDALEGHYEQIHFTLLDPLEGYYNGAQADILTGQRVNEHVVRKNFARVGMGEDQYTLIKHLSTEPEAMQKAATRKYDVLVIDGDHSYAGVKTDFENYAPLVRVGGYIILDDYNSPDWPDVKEYVDKELDKHDFIAPVGATWRTSVYRVVKDPAKPGRSQTSSSRKKSSPRPEAEDTQTSDE